MCFTAALIGSFFQIFQNSTSSERLCPTASLRNTSEKLEICYCFLLYQVKWKIEVYYDAMPRSSHLKMLWKISIVEISKHALRKDSRFAILLELNVVKGSVSPNRILNSLKFLPCIVLRGIVAYINISENFLCLGNPLLKELIFTGTYFCSSHEFAKIIKKSFSEKLE